MRRHNECPGCGIELDEPSFCSAKCVQRWEEAQAKITPDRTEVLN